MSSIGYQWGGGNENSVNPDNSGFADSPSFVLNTTDGSVTQPGDPISGFSDSGGFVLDTTESHGHGQSGFGDSNGFVLDTTGQDDHSDGNGTGGPNQPPADLNSTAPLFIADSGQCRRWHIQCCDPDGNSSLTYHLVSGAGMAGIRSLPLMSMVPSKPPLFSITKRIPGSFHPGTGTGRA